MSARIAALALALSGAITAAAAAATGGAATAPAPAAAKPAAAPASVVPVKPYPGATLYTPPATEQTKTFQGSLRPGTTISAFLTSDPFEKVLAFYRDIGKEYTNPKMPSESLPDGKPIQKAFVIFDGASDPATSKSWVRIQHPFIGSISQKGGTPEYQDVRDVTEIVATTKKQVPKEKKKEPGPTRSPPRSR